MKAELILNGQQYRVMMGNQRPCAVDLGVAINLIEAQFGESVHLWPIEVYHVVVYGIDYQVIFHRPLDKANPV